MRRKEQFYILFKNNNKKILASYCLLICMFIHVYENGTVCIYDVGKATKKFKVAGWRRKLKKNWKIWNCKIGRTKQAKADGDGSSSYLEKKAENNRVIEVFPRQQMDFCILV